MNLKQYFVEQGTGSARRICKELRKAGYKVEASSIGNQVTHAGLICTTMINVYNADGNEAAIVRGQDYFSRGI